MPAKRKNINLLPRGKFSKTAKGRVLKWALTTFRFIVIIVELIVVAGFLFRFYLDIQIGDLDEEINQKSALIQSRYDFEKEFRKTQLKLSVLSTLGQDSNKNSPTIEFLSQSIPTDTQLVSYSKTGNTFTIRGAALSEFSINAFINSVRNSYPETSLIRLEKTNDSPFIMFTVETKT